MGGGTYRKLPIVGFFHREVLGDAVGRGGAGLRRLLPTVNQTAMHCSGEITLQGEVRATRLLRQQGYTVADYR